VAAQGELGDIIWQALSPRVTVGEVKGARSMLEAILAALPNCRQPPT
jgi:hypothetical protein